MVSNYMLLPPQLRNPRSTRSREVENFKRAWTNYNLATGINDKPEAVQLATLLTIIGKKAEKYFLRSQNGMQ